jgi:hypothetical protein
MNYRIDFFILKNVSELGFFGINYFTPERKNSLKASVTPLFRRTSCRITLDQVKFIPLWIT